MAKRLDSEAWLTSKAAGAFVGVSHWWINKLGCKGRLERKKVTGKGPQGGSFLYSRSSLIAYKQGAAGSYRNDLLSTDELVKLAQDRTTSALTDDLQFLFKCVDKDVLTKADAFDRIRERVGS